MQGSERARFTLNKFTVLSLQLYMYLELPEVWPFISPASQLCFEPRLIKDRHMHEHTEALTIKTYNNFIAGNLKSCNWITFEPTLVAVECNLSPISQEKHVL